MKTIKEYADNLVAIADRAMPKHLADQLKQTAAFLLGLGQQNLDLRNALIECLKVAGIDVTQPDAQAKLDAASKLPSVAIQQYIDSLKSSVPAQAVCFFMDGNQMCAVFGDYKNPMESAIGFGSNFEEALAALKQNHLDRKADCEFSDGCDHDGFEGGCVRFGHTPQTCPHKPVNGLEPDGAPLPTAIRAV